MVISTIGSKSIFTWGENQSAGQRKTLESGSNNLKPQPTHNCNLRWEERMIIGPYSSSSLP